MAHSYIVIILDAGQYSTILNFWACHEIRLDQRYEQCRKNGSSKWKFNYHVQHNSNEDFNFRERFDFFHIQLTCYQFAKEMH